MKHLRRACSLTLAFALALSLSLTSAFAADYTTLDPSQFASNIGDTPTITQDGDTVTLSLPEAGVSIILEGVVSFEEFPSGWSSGETFGAFHLADDGRVLMRNDSYEYSSLELMPSYWQAEYIEEDGLGWVYSSAGPILDQYCPIGTTVEYPTTVVAADPNDRSLAVLDDTLPHRTISNIPEGINVNSLYVYFIRDNGRVSLADRTINGISFDEYYNSAVSGQPEQPVEPETPEEPEASTTVAGFSDVHESDYFADAVKWAKDEGITGGTTPTTFSPSRTVTRAQAVTFLWRAAGKPEPASLTSPFTDVSDPGAYYYKAVLWAAEQGITKGLSASTFGTGSTLAYDQMLAFLARAADADTGSGGWSQAALDWAAENGLTDGLNITAKGACPRSDVVYCLWKQLA